MTEELRGNAMVDLVRSMVVALVDEPESVVVDGQLRNGCMLVNVKVANGDAGKVIGKQGRTARSLRTIVDAAGVKNKVRCELNIHDYTGGEGKGAA